MWNETFHNLKNKLPGSFEFVKDSFPGNFNHCPRNLKTLILKIPSRSNLKYVILCSDFQKIVNSGIPQNRSRMKKLLLVEDSRNIGTIAAKKLESELKMPVVWTKTMAETLALFESSRPNYFFAAVLDFVLPDAVNGEIIDAIVEKGIPSIVFTGIISPEIREMVWSKKVVDYILKDDPSSMEYLVSALKKIISNRTTKVLVVDDSFFFRKVISELLYVHQYRVLVAANAQDALDTLHQNPDIKLVLTDFYMPEMNGCELSIKIRQTFKKDDLAIIGISSEGDKNMAAGFLKSGANDFIVKQSFSVEEFYCRVNHCIENIDLIHIAKQAAIIDFLTGLYNRRYFFEQGPLEFRKAEKEGLKIACAMIDIDFFKKINDTHGHDVGDLVLTHFSSMLKEFAATTDLVARTGGEEFCILVLPDQDKPEKDKMSRAALEQEFNTLRSKIHKSVIRFNQGENHLRITVSIGVSFNTCHTFFQMIKTADEQLYQAKQNGRNQVAVSEN